MSTVTQDNQDVKRKPRMVPSSRPLERMEQTLRYQKETETRWEETDKQAVHLQQTLRHAVTEGYKTATLAHSAWQRIKNMIPGVLQVPHVALSDDGRILLAWENESEYLEIEALPEQAFVEVFWRNRKTKEYMGQDWHVDPEEKLPDDFYEKFLQFRVVR